MKLTKFAEELKEAFILELAAHGISPGAFEESLQRINTAEGSMKVAQDLNLMQDYLIRPTSAALGQLPGMALNAAGAGGIAAGITFDELERGVVDLNHALDREREKVQMVRRLTHNLKKEHGLT
jgi:hypothetical protein